MKGFKRDGIFHPITPYKGVRKSRDQSTKTLGVRLERLSDKRTMYHINDFDKEPLNLQERMQGNEIIRKIVASSKKLNPLLENQGIINIGVYNEHDNIQKTFYYSKDAIDKLLEWREDGSPKTWKWKSPIILHSKEDDANGFFEHDAYKGKVTIVLMSPRLFMSLASPKGFLAYEMNNNKLTEGLGGETVEQSEESIKNIADSMKKGEPISTPYLNVDLKELRVFQHEGRHRAFGALDAGIKQMPVYIYTDEPMTDSQRIRINKNPFQVLQPDSRY